MPVPVAVRHTLLLFFAILIVAIAAAATRAETASDIGPPPAIRFVPSDVVENARRDAEKLQVRAAAEKTAAEELGRLGASALNAGDSRAAADYFRRAVGLTKDDPAPWLGLARAALAITPSDGNETYSLPREATSAALTAYGLTRTADLRAEALAVLAQALERRELFRPALEAYKASLALADSAPIRQAFLDLRSRKGFRVVDHSVDADTLVPRICVQFSDDLVKSGSDYSSYVTLDGKPASGVEKEDRQLCIGGLSHGQRYRLALRQGLPAAIGESLEAPVTLEVYVRDRSADVRFTGNNFVLPTSGAKGVPVVTVNAPEVELTLYRIGDRGLARVIGDGKFLQQLDGYDADTIRETSGELVWKGIVETRFDLNKEVLTLVPLDQLVPRKKPGVYVLVGRPRWDKSEEWKNHATQWFVLSNIGLSTFAGDDGLTVFARALDSARPAAGLELKLIARNNEILGAAKTDGEGRARFEPGLVRGAAALAPAAITASDGERNDFVFLDLTRPGFDLGDRGVTGRKAPGPVDAFMYTERGIYRAGDTVHVLALARDDGARPIPGLPLTFIFKRPDGVEFRRVTTPDLGGASHWTGLQLPQNVPLGTWTVAAYTDPTAEPVAERQFLVEDFVPDRTEFTLSLPGTVLRAGADARAEVDGRFLYGAPASDMRLEGEVRVSSTRSLKGFEGYVFGLADEDAISNATPLEELPKTDAAGKASFPLALGELPSSTRPLEATLILRMREGSGRAVERTASLPIDNGETFIGIKPSFAGDTVRQGAAAEFVIIDAGVDGTRRAAGGLRWSLLRLEREYQWYRSGENWNYEPVLRTQKVADGSVDATLGDPAKISVPTEWGRYRLDIENPIDGAATSYEFTSGWYVDQATTETPDGLEIGLDKSEYRAGDTARLSISPRFAGESEIVVGTDRVLWRKRVEVAASGGVIDIPVAPELGAGGYVTVVHFRPGDNGDTRMPHRAIGIKWLKVAPGAKLIGVSLAPPARMLPRQTLTIPVSLSNIAPGEEAYVAVAAVDVGILNLTRYQTPDPDGWYFGQRRLGIEIRDLYGQLIDGTTGALGRVRSGGDQGGMAMQGSPPVRKLVAFFSGPVRVDQQGKATVSIAIPEFNGSVRVMTTAWSAHGFGHAETDVLVRDPIVVTAGVARFLAPGDRSVVRLDIANEDGPAGDYQLDLQSSGELAVERSGVPTTVALTSGQRLALTVPITARSVGTGSLTVRLSRALGPAVELEETVSVRASQPPVTERRVVSLRAGGSTLIGSDLLAGRSAETAKVTLGVSRSAGFDVPSLLSALDRYPLGCAEQTVSRALPLLYLSEVARQSGMAEDASIRARVQDAIERVLAYQAASGSFGLWSPGSGDLWLDSYVTDFLTRAREENYRVPDQAFALALDNLENSLSYDANVVDQGPQMAYAIYVLARNRRASVGDLRYFGDDKLESFGTVMARAQIAASLDLYGEKGRAGSAFASAFRLLKAKGENWSRSDYGSRLRDGAAMLALAAESRPVPGSVADMIEYVAGQRLTSDQTSTQENAWLLLAARAVQAEGGSIRLDVNGTETQGNYARTLSGPDLVGAPLTVTNVGSGDVAAVVTVIAVPDVPLPAGGQGFTIERNYFHLDGLPADASRVAQNKRLVAVVKVTQTTSWPARIAITDLLPAGFEVDNPKLVKSADLAAFDWLPDITAAHTEVRSDRFVVAFDRNPEEKGELTFAYVVRAVSPGTYVHPPAIVEDMYRPHLAARTATGRMEVTGPSP
jgi:uncharacterized protein YfaS (alpha-2-macroglobulin family)